MPDPVEPLRSIIENHRVTSQSDDAEVSCSCGAEKILDHPRHVAEHIIDRLGLKTADVDEAKQQIRYATAWLNWELTELEGVQG